MTSDKVKKCVDARSANLIAELREHVEDVQRQYPDITDERKIFESWVIQKIAGLQLAVVRADGMFRSEEEMDRLQENYAGVNR